MMSVVYGPVSSWRLGSSLGIDLISTPAKTCSFDCIYCQLGKTIQPLTERREFVALSRVVSDLQYLENVKADHATFSGVGEPTLASNLGQAIDIVKSALGLPVAVLTNSCLMYRDEVRDELARADVVVAKLDAPNQSLFLEVNRPFGRLRLDEILEGLKRFRRQYRGKFCLQMMFVEDNKDSAAQMARLAAALSPDEVQINTPLRPCAVEPLPPDEIAAIQREFSGMARVVTVYEASRPRVKPKDPIETRRRRPAEKQQKKGGK
jgi:wyosine [tRNA(Phe)-imidazoG37] synthetase (radical SAM superfamily)